MCFPLPEAFPFALVAKGRTSLTPIIILLSRLYPTLLKNGGKQLALLI